MLIDQTDSSIRQNWARTHAYNALNWKRWHRLAMPPVFDVRRHCNGNIKFYFDGWPAGNLSMKRTKKKKINAFRSYGVRQSMKCGGPPYAKIKPNESRDKWCDNSSRKLWRCLKRSSRDDANGCKLVFAIFLDVAGATPQWKGSIIEFGSIERKFRFGFLWKRLSGRRTSRAAPSLGGDDRGDMEGPVENLDQTFFPITILLEQIWHFGFGRTRDQFPLLKPTLFPDRFSPFRSPWYDSRQIRKLNSYIKLIFQLTIRNTFSSHLSKWHEQIPNKFDRILLFRCADQSNAISF